ncbi:MAG: LLM class flavin-dependent oxidoreductase [Frankiales bacterium]|nr:LLM class flavin-dependent oxidoreductase [Frankiales bacterium]
MSTSATGSVSWGAVLPHGAAGEFGSAPGTQAWARLRDAATAWDELGYDHLWMSDHLMTSAGDRTGNYFESYTALAALSQVTRRAQLGALVTCALYRNIAILAKQGAAVDVMSNGRFILGLGGGWDEPEFDAFGLEFPSPTTRVEVFIETMEALTELWTRPAVDYDGTHLRLKAASCTPRPAAKPPIMTGTHGPRGLRAAARLADIANWNVGLEDFRRLSGVLDKACAEVGREPGSITRSVFRLADLTGNDDTVLRLLAEQGAPAELADAVKADHFIGTPDEVVPKVQSFIDSGARHVICLFLDAEGSDVSAERFLQDVAPAVAVPH